MSPRMVGHLRTTVTLAVLALLFVYAVVRGLDAVSEPFPEMAEAPVCVESEVTRGDVLRPGGITVSVVNAGRTTGLARSTLDDLVDQGFARGEVLNERNRRIRSAQVQAVGGGTPAVRLVRSYLGGRVTVADREPPVEGIVVVVGDEFAGVRQGQPRIRVTADSTVCGPPALG